MKKEREYRTKTRLLRIMRAMLESPFTYTSKRLQGIFGESREVIRDDFKAFKEAGFEYEVDKKHRYGFIADKPYNELKDLLLFSDQDQLLLMQALDKVAPHSAGADKLKRKLATLYDFTRTGHPLLRKPYLTKYDLLEKAKKEKKQVVLVDYRSSNSNEISDRTVEPFAPSLDDDTLQAFDIDKKDLRHFRISRITKIKWTDIPWQYEIKHKIIATDPFRIVDDNQVMVHLKLKVGAANELKERFPLTQPYILPAAQAPDEFDFQCKVNHKFLGITNFILGYHHQVVEVLEPDALLQHLQQEVAKMPIWEK